LTDTKAAKTKTKQCFFGRFILPFFMQKYSAARCDHGFEDEKNLLKHAAQYGK